ncbi:CCA tRNA nucleotidyltransferase [Macrococcus bovicus]|uniref:CCA tRNA nucleotidyltransferase n=1 Tax=Macrococcus bovicus TaxID=69968 RepID=UPI0025A4E6FE|nr:CCA tRNA nucleotidyltransferase [Macrococcus bovicus]WJP96840.1 CCA tRNA nucleotidyltransferase [Macrococcus bovicus]
MDKLKSALPVLDQLQRAGYEAYIVGGAVRNHLLELPISDVDITTSALPDEVEALFERTVPIGKEHGTVMVILNGTFEVTTFRIDGDYEDHRRPDSVIFVSDLKEDLLRRDFTVNAMALDHSMSVIDYTGGQNDLEQRLIRAVGDAERRFSEDALRMIRAARFQSVLDFTIESQTLEAMKTCAPLIEYVAVERIIVELQKLLHGLQPSRGINTLTVSGIVNYLPYFREWQEVLLLEAPMSLEVYIAFHIFKGLADMDGMRSLKLSNDSYRTIKQTVAILQQLEQQEEFTMERLVYHYPLATIEACQKLVGDQSDAKAYRQARRIHSRQDIAVNGRDVMTHLKREGGSWLKVMLAEMEDAIITGQLKNQPDAIMKWVDEHGEI